MGEQRSAENENARRDVGGPGSERLRVAKTLKMYSAGALVRSESGATFAAGGWEIPDASRKDVRDAVRSGAVAANAWSARDPYNRGQIIYRVAEMLECRVEEFVGLAGCLGVPASEARADVLSAVDAWVHYAGWSDKCGQVFATVNDVSGPFTSFTQTRPLGLVAVVVDPDAAACLGPVSAAMASCLAAGNAVTVTGSGVWSVLALTFAEVLATSDVPPGAVQILSSIRPEAYRTLVAASQVAGVDCSLAGELSAECALLSADTFTRRLGSSDPSAFERMRWQLERQTIWHPASL